MRILVVDHDEQKIDQLEHLLGSRGHDVMVAQNVDELRRIVKRTRPDMIIGHIGSPSFSGLALLETLKLRTFEDMPFFIYSNLNKVETIELCFRLGAWGAINKNINDKDIDDCLSLVA